MDDLERLRRASASDDLEAARALLAAAERESRLDLQLEAASALRDRALLERIAAAAWEAADDAVAVDALRALGLVVTATHCGEVRAALTTLNGRRRKGRLSPADVVRVLVLAWRSTAQVSVPKVFATTPHSRWVD